MRLAMHKRDARCARRVAKRMPIRVIAWTVTQAGVPTRVSARNVMVGRSLWMAAVGVKSVQRGRSPMMTRAAVSSVLWETPQPQVTVKDASLDRCLWPMKLVNHKHDVRYVHRVVKRTPIRMIAFRAVAVISQRLEFAKIACLRMSSTRRTLYVAGLSSVMLVLSV